MKKVMRASHQSQQQQVRQVVTPQRPISQKQKSIENQIAKLNCELDLEQFSPQLQAIVSSAHLYNSRRALQKEHKLSTMAYKNQQEHRRADQSSQQFQTVSPVARLRASKDVLQNIIVTGTTSQKRLPERISIDEKRSSDQIKGEMSQSVIQSAFVPKKSQINHTASVQYYSSKAKRLVKDISQENKLENGVGLEDLSDSGQIVNVSTQVHQSSQNPKTSSIHQGIQYLQSNLKQLEGKYHDLAKLYSKKDRPSQSPKKRLQKKKTILSEQTSTPKRADSKPKTSSQTNLNRQIQCAYTDEASATDNAGASIEDPLMREFEQIMLFYKHQLDLKNERLNVYRMLKEDLHRLICTKPAPTVDQNENGHSQKVADSQSLMLELEFRVAEQKEAIFKAKHLNEQIQLEQKKALHLLQALDCPDRFADITACLTASKDRLTHQTRHFTSIEHFNSNLTLNLASFTNPDSTSGTLELQVQKLHAKIAEDQEAHSKQMHELESLSVDLQIKNKELNTQLLAQTQELTQKELLLTKRETQKRDLVRQLQSFTTRDTKSVNASEERWRHQLETLVHLTTRFLNAMRRLQKLVHKREPNVAAEKQDFENAKKDLEITLKTAFSSLQLASGERQSSLSDQISEVPHKHASQKDLTPPSETIYPRSERLIQQLTQDLETMRLRVTSAVSERQKLGLRLLQWETTAGKLSGIKDSLLELESSQINSSEQALLRVQDLEDRLQKILKTVQECKCSFDNCAAVTTRITQSTDQQAVELLQKEKELKANQAALEQLKSDHQQTLHQQQEAAENIITDLRRKVDQLNQALVDANTETRFTAPLSDHAVDGLIQSSKKAQQERDLLADEVKSLKAEHLDLQEKLKDASQREINQLQQQLSSSKTNNDKLSQQVLALTNQLSESDATRQSTEANYRLLQLQFDEHKEKNRVELINSQEALKHLQDINATQQSTIRSLDQKGTDLEQIILETKEAHRKMQELTSEQLDQKDQSLRHIEKEHLRKQNALQLEHALATKTIKEKHSNEIVGLTSGQLNAKVKLEEKILELQQELKVKTDETIRLNTEILQCQERSNTQISQASDELELHRSETDALRMQKNQHLQVIDDLKENCRKLGEQINQQTSSIRDIKLALKKKETQVRELEDQISDFQSRLELCQSLQETKDRANESLSGQLQEFASKLQNQEEEFKMFQNAEDVLRKNLAEEKQVSQELSNKVKETFDVLAQAQSANAQLRQQLDALLADKDDLTVQQQQKLVQQLQAQLEQSSKTSQADETEKKQLKEELSNARAQFEAQTNFNEQFSQKLEERNQLIVSLQDQLLAIQQEQIEASSKYKSLSADHDLLSAKLQKTESNEQTLILKVEQLNGQVAEQESQEQDRLTTLENNLSLIQKLKQRLEKSLIGNKEYKDAIQEANRAKEDLQSQCNTLCGFVLEANDENKRLESALFVSQQKEASIVAKNQELLQRHESLTCLAKGLKKEIETLRQALKEEKTDIEQDFAKKSALINEAFLKYQSQISKKLRDAAQLQQTYQSTSVSSDQTAYIQKLKEHFFQQEQHIEQLTSDAEVQKQQYEQNMSMIEIQLESAKIENKNLQEEVKKYFQKFDELEQELRNQNEEIAAKDELLEEANNFISEFNDEKHELKAKFKVLMGNLMQDHSVSSYRSSDEIDLDQCFEQLEAELMRRDESQHSRILQITQERDTVNQDLSSKVNILAERESQLNSLKIQLSQIEQTINQNERAVQTQLELATTKICKYKVKVTDLRQKNLNLERQLQNVKEIAQPVDIPSDSIVSQNSLVVENAQLLDRLQRTEVLLKQARDQTKTTSVNSSPDQIERLSEIEQKLDVLRRQVITSINEMREKILTKVEQELVQIKMAYVQDNIVCHNVLASTTLHSWNNLVELVSRVSVKDSHYLLILAQDKRIYLINEQDLTEQAYRYLMSFTDSDNCIVWSYQSEDEETTALQQLVSDLKQDLTDLRLEYLQYRTLDKLEFTPGEDTAGLIEEIEYLTGENKDLHLKVKEICLQNAELKIQLAMRLELHLDENLDNREGLIETARNISVLGDPEECKDQVDFISEQDSFGEVVDGMSPLDSSVERRLQEANQKIEALTERLQNTTSQVSDREEEEATIAHIKGTLLQFLKLTPFTEKQNEELLKIIYSMMEFSQAEISELQAARTVLKGNNKVVQQLALQGSGSRSNTSGVSSEGEKKVKKGLLSLFTKTKAKVEANNSQVYQTPAPTKK